MTREDVVAEIFARGMFAQVQLDATSYTGDFDALPADRRSWYVQWAKEHCSEALAAAARMPGVVSGTSP